MPRSKADISRPTGGLLAGRRLRAWRWTSSAPRSQPVRCRRAEWYLARLRPEADAPAIATVLVHFLKDGELISSHALTLHEAAGPAGEAQLLGWFETPDEASQLCMELTDPAQGDWLRELTLHPTAERDAKCHPLVNPPRWSALAAPGVRRVHRPAALAALDGMLEDFEIHPLSAEIGDLRRAARRDTAFLLDEPLVRRLGEAGVEELAGAALVIIDLPAQAWLMSRKAHRSVAPLWRRSTHGLMCARVDYADWATRGFALQDVFPYGVIDEDGRFAVRVLPKGPWKRYADRHGAARLLGSETPWVSKCGDLLAAARPIERGELVASDTPWLAAGVHGRPYAPRLMRHLVRMLLGAPCADHLQYWNRWDDTRVILRDIGDMTRYAPLQAFRWRSDGRLARFGLALSDAHAPRRRLFIHTGRIDLSDVHDGVAPEAMMVFMRWLAREVRERTPWARRCLADSLLVWQFDAAAGVYYAPSFESAARLPDDGPVRVLKARRGPRSALAQVNGASELTLAGDGGLLGDGALAYQDQLTRWLKRWIERGG